MKEKMLLAIDIGNTTTSFGFFNNDVLQKKKKIKTNEYHTLNELKILLKNFFPKKFFGATIIASVVPQKTIILVETLKKYYQVNPFILKTSNLMFFPIKYNLKQIGIDRLVAVISAQHKFGQPVMVINFGTATTIDIISKQGEFLGGVIIPGINLMPEILAQKTAKLPYVKLKKPKKIIGTNTHQAIQSGIIYGYIHLINGLVKQIIDELRYKPKVIATGGRVNLFKKEMLVVNEICPNLILEGLNILHQRLINKQV